MSLTMSTNLFSGLQWMWGSQAEIAAPPEPAAGPSRPRHWSPHQPWPKQRAFLALDCLEALYGGAAGGGKSEALLLAALQYVHVPGYAALILRCDTQRLSLPGGLIPRSHEWLAASGAKWSSVQKRWTFPTAAEPATITFGYLRERQDKYRYGSSEFQFIAFDELTEFPEDDYLFLFSRLRRRRGIDVPLRMRAASNPGNVGHQWVRSRFIPPAVHAPAATKESSPVHWHQGRAYVPARIADNAALDEQEYRQSLVHLPPLIRERLMNGDWTIQEQGLFQADWLRYYQTTLRGTPHEAVHLLGPTGAIAASVAVRDCRRFITMDPAGTSADRAQERRGRAASWTVAQVWEQPRGELAHVLILRHQVRERVGFDGLVRMLRELNRKWRPMAIWIENEKLGVATVDTLGGEMPLKCIATRSQDKVTRATFLIDKLQRGEIYLPQDELNWRPQLEGEWLAWTGDPQEPSDQIDAAAYAAIISAKYTPRDLRLSTLALPAAGPRKPDA